MTLPGRLLSAAAVGRRDADRSGAVMKLKKPIANVTYELHELELGRIGELVDRVLGI